MQIKKTLGKYTLLVSFSNPRNLSIVHSDHRLSGEMFMGRDNKKRSNQDELEILREIIVEDKYLLEEVLTKIRTNLKISKKGFYESVSGGDNELETKRKKVRDI